MWTSEHYPVATDEVSAPQPIGTGSAAATYNVKSAVNGAVFGPADSATLQGWLDEGRITPNCQLQQAGTQAWTPASAMFPALGAAAGVAASAVTGGAGDSYSQFKQSFETPDQSGELNPYAPALSPQVPGGPKTSREIIPTSGDIGFCISHGWKTWTENFGLLLAVSATVFGFNLLSNFMQQGVMLGLGAGGDRVMLGIGLVAVMLFSIVVQWWLYLGFFKLTCNLCRGERAEYAMLFGSARKLPIFLLIVLVLSVPFLILSLLTWPVYFMLADTELGFGSLSKGISIGMKNVLISIPIGFVACLAGIMGFIGCGIAIIATIPVCYTIMSSAYLNMSGQLKPR